MALLNLPQDWAPDVIIPSSWANNIGDNFTRVDARTGTDPGATGLFLASNGAVSAAWRTLTGADYKDGTIPDLALANPHVYRHDPVPLSFSAAGALGSGFFSLNQTADAPVPATAQWLLIQDRYANYGTDYRLQIACSLIDVNELYVRSIVNGVAGSWRKLWHGGNAGGTIPNPTIFAGTVGTQSDLTVQRTALGSPATGLIQFGNTGAYYIYMDGTYFIFQGRPGNFPQGLIAAATTLQSTLVVAGAATLQSTLLVAGIATLQSNLDVAGTTTLRGAVTTPAGIGATFGGVLTANNGIQLAASQIIQWPQQTGNKLLFTPDQQYGIAVDNASGLVLTTPRYIRMRNTGAGAGDYSFEQDTTNHTLAVHGHRVWHRGDFAAASTAPTPNAVPIADATGKLDPGWVTGGGGGTGGDGNVPLGGVIIWNSPTAPTGWVLETIFAGKFPLGIGGTLGFGLGSANTISTHNHTTNIYHGHGDDISGTVNAATGTTRQVNEVTPNPKVAADNHGHSFTRSGGVTSIANPTNVTSGDQSHVPPYYATNFIRRTG